MTINKINSYKNKLIFGTIVVLYGALIIVFPHSSLDGAKNGLLMWFNTVLPTLLPFMIVSNIIINMKIAIMIGKVLYPIFKFVFRVSSNACYPILIGFLSGMPLGAKTVADLVEKGDIDLDEGQYLLSFCNNASPMFVMSFIAISQLETPSLRFYLLFINFFSGYLGAILYFKVYKKSKRSFSSLFSNFNNNHENHYCKNKIHTLHTQELNNISSQNNSKIKFDFSIIDKAIMDSFEVITKVGGYIILFSIPAEVISSSPLVSPYIKIISIGLLEITTGINYISSRNLILNTKIILIVAITAFGGLSALAQTNSVINQSRLSISVYFKNKIIQLLIAIIMALFMINQYL